MVLPSPAEFPPPWSGGWGIDRGRPYISIVIRGVAIELVWIEPGTFWMGSPPEENGRWNDELRHEVTLTCGFWLGRYPVTQEQFKAVTAGNPSQSKGPKHPVDSVTWREASAFCDSLNQRLQTVGLFTPGLLFRLPTEAEWEYACRAGTESAFHDGSPCTQPQGEDRALDRLGWYKKNSMGQTHPVGEKSPNSWGLYDLHGNVWEWCQDGHRIYTSEPQVDPIGSTRPGSRRVLRGGSCWNLAWGCRSAVRDVIAPDVQDRDIGFRLAAGQSGGIGVVGVEARGVERRGQGPAPELPSTPIPPPHPGSGAPSH